MGEWSEYFEDFPEENPANCVNGQFDPNAAARQRTIEESNRLVAKESQFLQQKMFEIAKEAKRAKTDNGSKNSTQAKTKNKP
jgi:hypothetical protein